MPRRLPPRGLSVVIATCSAVSVGVLSAGDEGMWTFDNPPVQQLEAQYGFTPSPEWLEHVRLSSVRLNDGGSGSFVSARGLVMTNHHVGLNQVQNLSSPDADYVTQGFYAPNEADELQAPDLEINVLLSTEDVTRRVNAAVTATASEREALSARQAEIALIEKESLDATGLRSQVVSLYRGGEYWLYRYKQYTDVRLVFAPETQAAFFGGDSDNFTYPRFCLDVAFFRVYEDGEPADTSHYLRLDRNGPDKDELVFVVGNPGSTDRLRTVDQFRYERDVRHPAYLKYFETYERLLREYAARGPEQARQVGNRLLGITNSRKALTGQLRGLQDPNVWASLERREADVRQRIAGTTSSTDADEAWLAIGRATTEAVRTFTQRVYRSLAGSTLAEIAGMIVRYVEETPKPDAERLPGYHDSEIAALEFRLFSPAPVYPDREEHLIAGFLEAARQELGTDDSFVSAVLGDRSPANVAAQLVRNTGLADVDTRRALVAGGADAVTRSDDPMIAIVRRLDPQRRADEEAFRTSVESVLEESGAVLARARFEAYGRAVHPDATFTPRLAYGTVTGYPMNGTQAPHETTLFGLFDRAISFGREGEYALPDRYWRRRDRLDLATPVNFVSTADITGGNSGSPVIDVDGNAVGLIFDGNIESLVGTFAYDDRVSRAIAVHPGYILEALEVLYDAEPLAQELTAGRPE